VLYYKRKWERLQPLTHFRNCLKFSHLLQFLGNICNFCLKSPNYLKFTDFCAKNVINSLEVIMNKHTFDCEMDDDF